MSFRNSAMLRAVRCACWLCGQFVDTPHLTPPSSMFPPPAAMPPLAQVVARGGRYSTRPTRSAAVTKSPSRPATTPAFSSTTSGTAASPIEFFAEPGVLINSRESGDQPRWHQSRECLVHCHRRLQRDRHGPCGRAFGRRRRDDFAEHVTIRNVTRDQQRLLGHLHRLRRRLADREQRDLGLDQRARHLRLQQRRPAGDSQQRELQQPRQRHPHERRCSARAATASSPTRS